jgi:hypothetical protein
MQASRAAGSANGSFNNGNGAVASQKFGEKETADCSRVDPNQAMGLSLSLCLYYTLLIHLAYPGSESTAKNKLLHTKASDKPGAAAGSPATLALDSGTPYLPFLGNPFVVVSYVANGTTASSTTEAYSVDLRRQSDCTLVEDFTLPSASTPTAAAIASLPGAQDYFHQLAGLTSKADVFPSGCIPPVLGQPATTNILLLGNTQDGAAISAELSDAGLMVSVTDSTTNTFKTTTLVTGSIAGTFSAADLNGDGILDLVVTGLNDPATTKPSTAAFLGNGDGTFKAGVYNDVTGALVIDDVNADGKADIVLFTQTSMVNTGYPVITGTVTTLLGKGDGTFQSGITSPVTWSGGLGPAVTGDFNGDGKRDVLIGGTVLLGAGDGTFTVGPSNAAIATAACCEVGADAVGDLNHDGKLDVAVTEPGLLAIFYGNGDGSFKAGPVYAALPDYEQVSITDIDGDGNPDIVLGTASQGIYTAGGYDIQPDMFEILMGRGDGTFIDSRSYVGGSFGGIGNNTSGYGQEIASGDFNGDGKPDVLVLNPSFGGTAPNQLMVLPGDGTGSLGTAITTNTSITPTVVLAADLNKDGKLDAVVLSDSLVGGTQLAVLFGKGDGTFGNEQDYTLPNGAVSLAVGDFNGDGQPDVAVGVGSYAGTGGPSGVYVLPGQAGGILGTPVKIDSSVLPVGLSAADLNGDGRTDLVVADQGTYSSSDTPINGALHVYLGNANGTFASVAAPSISATYYTVVSVGDLNQDGKPDLVVGGDGPASSSTSGGPNIYTLLGNGDGTFQAAVTQALGSANGQANSIALADFNKDGHVDVVVGNTQAFTEVLLGNGDGTLSDSLLALGQRAGTVAAADLNGDGFPELLVGTPDVIFEGGALTVFMNANAWSASTTPTPTVSVPNVVGQTQAAASTAITGAGLVVGTVTQQASSTVSSGMVISESPAAGASVASGASVALVVSSGAPMLAVPNVVGMTQSAASADFKSAGLALGTVTDQASTTVTSGEIISESPAAGTSVAAGSVVAIVVSSGPAAIPVTANSSHGGGGALDWFLLGGLFGLSSAGLQRRCSEQFREQRDQLSLPGGSSLAENRQHALPGVALADGEPLRRFSQ